MRTFSTPMMQQYQAIKQQYTDCLLFFRLGDFYELFLDDAKVGAEILGITLTQRPRGKDGEIPMAGVPYHAADAYIAKLITAGQKVAICEQLTPPDQKGIVERDVVRIVTPGTVLDEKTLPQKEHNYTISLVLTSKHLAIARADLSTGDFCVSQCARPTDIVAQIATELSRIQPAECILSDALYNTPEILGVLRSHGVAVTRYDDWDIWAAAAAARLRKHFGVKSLHGFGVAKLPEAQQAAATLLGYLEETQKGQVAHITSMRTVAHDDAVSLDPATIANLELFHTMRDGASVGSLLHAIDQTKTAMGGRLLRSWLTQPLTQKVSIDGRLDAVAMAVADHSFLATVQAQLAQIPDIERILGRLALGTGTAIDLVALRRALENAVALGALLADTDHAVFTTLSDACDATITDTIDHIATHIVDDPPFDVRGGGLIAPGVDAELDTVRTTMQKGKDWVAELEKAEREKTGIGSLKVRYNKVFGYYIEVSHANSDRVPETYIRKQTMTNAERYVTEDLLAKERVIVTAEEQTHAREYDLFQQSVATIVAKTPAIQRVAQAIAGIDCIMSLAAVARTHNYVHPTMTEDGTISITAGRHPVVEQTLGDTPFVPNDVTLDDAQQLLVLTGPNMAGKSVLMRQVALCVLLAHIGSFVPATKASISCVDQIFVRSGATDAISAGLSTFMTEMVETAHILRHATDKSLIIMDEIGRGTSTYDGISIAWAVAEHIVAHIGAKTLFATHYHELQELEKSFPAKIANYTIAVDERDGMPIFLHTLIRGGASHSHGVNVARLAGVPDAVSARAQEKLETLESLHDDDAKKKTGKKRKEDTATQKKNINEESKKSDAGQQIEKMILKQLHEIDVNNLTPMEALTVLAEMKGNVRNE